jgi:hypothetical protein
MTSLMGRSWSRPIPANRSRQSILMTAASLASALAVTLSFFPTGLVHAELLSHGSNLTTAGVAEASTTGIQLVQATATGNESTASSISATFASSTVAGDLLVVTGTAARPASTLSATDTAGDTFLTALGPVNDPNQDVDAYIWYVRAARGAANTVTITPATASALEIHISEYSGAASTAPLDRTSWATGSSTTASSGSATTQVSGELVFGYSFVVPTSSSPGSGFTGLSNANGDWDEYALQPAAGSP